MQAKTADINFDERAKTIFYEHLFTTKSESRVWANKKTTAASKQ